jgi:hypothetical protein
VLEWEKRVQGQSTVETAEPVGAVPRLERLPVQTAYSCAAAKVVWLAKVLLSGGGRGESNNQPLLPGVHRAESCVGTRAKGARPIDRGESCVVLPYFGVRRTFSPGTDVLTRVLLPLAVRTSYRRGATPLEDC